MNNTIKNLIQIGVAGILTGCTYLFGDFDDALKVLLIMIVTDYASGVLKAWQKGELSSKIGRDGIVKKIGYLMIVAVAYNLDKLTGGTGAIRTMVIYFFVSNEGISILENWGEMGLPIPKILLEKFQQIKDQTTDIKTSEKKIKSTNKKEDELIDVTDTTEDNRG